jgi:hypothetical protein
VFSTFLGVSDLYEAFGIAVDSKGNSYVTGETRSSDFPISSDAAQTLCDRSSGRCSGDAFLTELNASGSGLIYSTFLGGGHEDGGNGIALDSSNNAYVTGFTVSPDFPVSAGALQKSCGGNCVQSSSSLPIPYDAFVAMFGTAASKGAPAVSLSPTTLALGNQPVANAGSPQSLTLTNTGNADLTSLTIAISGADAGDFTQTNACAATLAAGAGCAIEVTFNPAAAGSRTATLQISDNAPSSPQSLGLSGTGTAGLGLAIAPGTSSTATLAAGSSAGYTLSLGGAGFAGTVSLACTGAPSLTTCSVPSSVTASAATASTVPVSVLTTGNSVAELNRPMGPPLLLSASALALLFLPRRIRRKMSLRLFGLLALAAATLSLSACGALGSILKLPQPQGPTPGTYTLTVTANSGSMTQSTQLTLIVP